MKTLLFLLFTLSSLSTPAETISREIKELYLKFSIVRAGMSPTDYYLAFWDFNDKIIELGETTDLKGQDLYNEALGAVPDVQKVFDNIEVSIRPRIFAQISSGLTNLYNNIITDIDTEVAKVTIRKRNKKFHYYCKLTTKTMNYLGSDEFVLFEKPTCTRWWYRSSHGPSEPRKIGLKISDKLFLSGKLNTELDFGAMYGLHESLSQDY